ncbi:cobalt/nickel transport system permease [Thermosulfidibacter takaii ABI70S6]|uniref:Cobalt/nickel transport system permease n=1 Tax=Thermosulfidibacter takaii (strain DSM 17441 / JCM 13301 / NBRC 103674 / ABI70S6) TaxID=1298851 RepID=A0A0S3QUC3_THET7|nr:energy-coupling factor ABC transporter permease [Thermosulfidibacter takaii]BAT71935.1 cobalt/nickel transport system permease [Thermosulfidibacter takaii ABI70S6]
MHIPDGFLSVPVALSTLAVSGAAVVHSTKKVSNILGDKEVPLVGVMAACIFAAQMLNFPVAGGTSGHLIGGALVAIVLGPEVGVLVMTSVLLVQALIFQDGGITALGANILNMGVIASYLGYFAYKLGTLVIKNDFVCSFLAGWFSVFVAAVACSLELALSGTIPLKVVLPAMAGVHALIGIGEGLITAFAVAFIRSVKPEILHLKHRSA